MKIYSEELVCFWQKNLLANLSQYFTAFLLVFCEHLLGSFPLGLGIMPLHPKVWDSSPDQILFFFQYESN